MYKDKIVQIGSQKLIEWEAKIEKIELSVNDGTGRYVRQHFGQYGVFTVPTQHFYGSSEDVSYVLGMVEVGNRTEREYDHSVTMKAMELAEKDEFQHAKEICNQLDIEYPSHFTTAKELTKYMQENSYTNNSNYFYWVRGGAALKHKYELLLNLKK